MTCKINKKLNLINVKEASYYLGVSRSTFWRLSRSKDFPKKVVTDNGEGYDTRDLYRWVVKKMVEKEMNLSDGKYLGKLLFVIRDKELARAVVMENALCLDIDPMQCYERFLWLLTSLKEAQKKLLLVENDPKVTPYESNRALDEFEAVKREIIRLVFPEVDTDKISVLDF